MAKRSVVTFDDFSFGEFGSLGSWNAPQGSFTGQNVMRYVDGSLGPRNGLKAYTLTGVAASAVRAAGVISTNDIWFQNAADNAFSFDPYVMTSQAVASFGAGSWAWQSVNVDSYVYYITATAGIRRLDPAVPADTAVASSPNGRSLVAYGERFVAGADASTPSRIVYSAAGDITSWPAANFIDIGRGNFIAAIIPIRDSLAIATYRLTGGVQTGVFRWWLLTGVPGVNDTLREVVQAQSPSLYREAAVLQDGRIAFASPLSEQVAFFDGSRTQLVRHLSVGSKGASNNWSVHAMRDEADVLFVSDLEGGSSVAYAYFRRGGAWFKQALSEANIGHLAVRVDDYSADLMVFAGKQPTPSFYAWQSYNDRPPFSGDTYASILSPSVVYFETPEWWTRDGEEVAVRKVIVGFRDWDTDDTDANQFDVVVTPLRQYEGGEGATQTGSFSRATSASGAAGVNLNREFGFTFGYGHGFKVKIANMRGVAIHKIQVVLDVRPVQGI